MQNDDLFVSWTDNTEFVVMCLKVKKKKLSLLFALCFQNSNFYPFVSFM